MRAGRWSIATDATRQAAGGALSLPTVAPPRPDERGRPAGRGRPRARSPIGAACARELRLSARAEGGRRGNQDAAREAAGLLESSPARLERARVPPTPPSAPPCGRPATQRRAGRPAEGGGPGAPLWRPAARGSSVRGTARDRRPPTPSARDGAGTLTPSERRIAELAAGGPQNRDIAQALFVTTNTVEFHLRMLSQARDHVRTQLGDALGPSNGGDHGS